MGNRGRKRLLECRGPAARPAERPAHAGYTREAQLMRKGMAPCMPAGGRWCVALLLGGFLLVSGAVAQDRARPRLPPVGKPGPQATKPPAPEQPMADEPAADDDARPGDRVPESDDQRPEAPSPKKWTFNSKFYAVTTDLADKQLAQDIAKHMDAVFMEYSSRMA